MKCNCSESEGERTEPREEEDHSVTFRRHEIALTKDAPDRNWYIVVRAPSGLMCYDGWWHESTGKTWREALEEAKRGAFLTHFKEQSNDR